MFEFETGISEEHQAAERINDTRSSCEQEKYSVQSEWTNDFERHCAAKSNNLTDERLDEQRKERNQANETLAGQTKPNARAEGKQTETEVLLAEGKRKARETTDQFEHCEEQQKVELKRV